MDQTAEFEYEYEYEYRDHDLGSAVFENVSGHADGLDQRGRHPNFKSALDSAFKDLQTEHDEFFDSLADRWHTLFPKCAARPGRYEDGKIFLYVSSAPALFTVRPRLNAMRRTLGALPGAPKKIDLKLEIRKP